MKKADKKCIWTGKKSDQLVEIKLKTINRFTFSTNKTFYVSPQYVGKLRKFNEKLVRYGRTFLYLIFTLTTIIVIVPLGLSSFPEYHFLILPLTGMVTILIGLLIIIIPFATPETVQWLGLRKAIKFTRTLGYLTIAIGIILVL